MVAFPRQGLIPSTPVLAGTAFGVAVALAIAVVPEASLANIVWNSGIAALIPAAEPPLGITARAVLALASGAAVAAVGWAVMYLLVGPGGFLAPRVRGEDGAPAIRRADAHPDAPPRKPMLAADLGTPLMEVAPAERALPADLDQPIAAFDPGAVPAVPMTPVPPLPPLARPTPPPPPMPTPVQPPVQALEPGERIATFALTPAPPAGRVAPPRIDTAERPSLEALLRRLEEGATRRVARG